MNTAKEWFVKGYVDGKLVRIYGPETYEHAVNYAETQKQDGSELTLEHDYRAGRMEDEKDAPFDIFDINRAFS